MYSLTCHYALHRKRTDSSFGTKRRRRLSFHRYGVDVLFLVLFVCVAHMIAFTHIAIYYTIDPENALYDDLDLRRGVKETFFSPSTPFAFLERFTKKDGMKELGEVLSKWNKACLCSTKARAGLFTRRYVCI